MDDYDFVGQRLLLWLRISVNTADLDNEFLIWIVKLNDILFKSGVFIMLMLSL